MKKVITIGDLHGLPAWKKIDPKIYDQIIFIGDYIDHEHILPTFQLKNLLEIIEFKKQYPDKVILLLGNHDCSYLYYPKYSQSGFLETWKEDFHRLYKVNEHLFQIAFQIKNYLWTHAGLSNSYFEWLQDTLEMEFEINDLAVVLNTINKSELQEILHTISKHRGRENKFAGIFWADGKETCDDQIPNLHQIVRHSRVKDIITFKKEEADSSITYVDCLDSIVKFYELEIDD